MSANSNQNTLTNDGFRDRLDDSLCGDEFEIIENENDEANAEPVFSSATIHWSIPNSIAMTPLLDRESLQLPNSANSSILINPAPTPTNPTPNGQDLVDTSIMSGTMLSSSTSTLSSTDSDKLMMSVQQQLTESKEVLEKFVRHADTMQKDATEVKELKERNAELIKANSDFLGYKDQLEEEKMTLNQTIQDLAAKIENYKLRTTSLEEDLKAVNLRLQCHNQNKPDSNDKFVMDQLDVLCAKFLEEKERRLQAEDLINCMTFGDTSRSLSSQTATADQLREKSQQVDKLEEEMAKMKQEMEKIERENADLKAAVGDKDAIISVIMEENNEGTRLIAEREHRIDELDRIMRGMHRAEVNNV